MKGGAESYSKFWQGVEADHLEGKAGARKGGKSGWKYRTGGIAVCTAVVVWL